MSKNIFTIIIFFTLKRLFKNFLLVQLIKLSLFINALCAVALINLKFLVNLDFVPHVVGIPKNLSLILIFFTMVLLLLFIPLVVTLNGIHISMLLLLLVDLIKIINTLIKDISMLIQLLDNGKNLLLILLKVVIIKIKSLKRKLKLLLLLFIKKIQDFSLTLLKMI